MSYHVTYYYQSGRTALHLAAEKGHTEVIKLLLYKGAKTAAVDNVSQIISISPTVLSSSVLYGVLLIIIIIIIRYFYSTLF